MLIKCLQRHLNLWQPWWHRPAPERPRSCRHRDDPPAFARLCSLAERRKHLSLSVLLNIPHLPPAFLHPAMNPAGFCQAQTPAARAALPRAREAAWFRRQCCILMEIRLQFSIRPRLPRPLQPQRRAPAWQRNPYPKLMFATGITRGKNYDTNPLLSFACPPIYRPEGTWLATVRGYAPKVFVIVQYYFYILSNYITFAVWYLGILFFLLRL